MNLHYVELILNRSELEEIEELGHIPEGSGSGLGQCLRAHSSETGGGRSNLVYSET